jgi:hypothetical protein
MAKMNIFSQLRLSLGFKLLGYPCSVLLPSQFFSNSNQNSLTVWKELDLQMFSAVTYAHLK